MSLIAPLRYTFLSRTGTPSSLLADHAASLD